MDLEIDAALGRYLGLRASGSCDSVFLELDATSRRADHHSSPIAGRSADSEGLRCRLKSQPLCAHAGTRP